MARDHGITAQELMDRLRSDPRWVAESAARDARRAERSERLRADEASLLADLARVGVRAATVYDFVGGGPTPPEALPVLVRHLDSGHLPAIREGVIRALSISDARAVAFVPLHAAYRSEGDPSVRWVIANALASMARLEELSELPGIDEYAALFA